MVEINLGINLVEIVTSGLYKNSLDIIREYIQNSCDAIDDAIKAGILADGEGKVTIDIDKNNRRITIEDNGIGISAVRDFVRVMSSIGHSDKNLRTSRGFRGIGRLGGLAYCRTLIFSSKVAGEKKISTLTINAEKLRQEFFNNKKRSAEQALIANMSFNALNTELEDKDDHFFRVEMIDVVDTNEDLLNVAKVRDYLSFVAPVTYDPQFSFQQKIYKYAAKINFKITEYDIRVNGEPLVKNYKTDIRTTKDVSDKIFDVQFREVRDKGKNLIAWFWFGLSEFKGVLSEKHGTESYKMRGIRLRQKNIQIGDALIFRNVFKEEQRGTKYFIGEVHTIDTNLRPNSERDDFEENAAYNNLKAALRICFHELNDLYRAASNVRTVQNVIKRPEKIKSEFQGGRSSLKNQSEFEAEFTKRNEEAMKAKNDLRRIRREAEIASDTVKSQVIRRVIENQRPLDSAEIQKFPPENWSEDLCNLYETIKWVILDNKNLSGDTLLKEIIKALSK